MKYDQIFCFDFCCGVVFFSMCFVDYFVYKGEERDFIYLHFLPGLLFSTFMIFLHFRFHKIPRILTDFILSNILYLLAFYIGISTFGTFVPVVGGFGAWLIRVIFNFENRDKDHFPKMYFIFGLVAGGFGLIVFSEMNGDIQYTVGFGIIVALWQLIIGLVCIRHVEFREAELKRRVQVFQNVI